MIISVWLLLVRVCVLPFQEVAVMYQNPVGQVLNKIEEEAVHMLVCVGGGLFVVWPRLHWQK